MFICLPPLQGIQYVGDSVCQSYNAFNEHRILESKKNYHRQNQSGSWQYIDVLKHETGQYSYHFLPLNILWHIDIYT